jgi:hypothetical protein
MWAVSWPAWIPTISVSFLPSCGTPAVAPGRVGCLPRSFQRLTAWELIMMTIGDDGLPKIN